MKTNLTVGKELINATLNCKPLKDMVGQTIETTGLVINEKTDSDGSVKTVTIFQTSDGEYFGTISEIACNLAEMVLAAKLYDGGNVDIKIGEGKSGKGRNYLTLEIV